MWCVGWGGVEVGESGRIRFLNITFEKNQFLI